MTSLRGGKGVAIGFPSPPPPLLHQSVIAWLQAALPLHVEALLPSQSSLTRLLSLLHLTFLLPPSSASSQLSVLSLYSRWLRGDGLSPLMRSHWQPLVTAMIDHVTSPLLYRQEGDAEVAGAGGAVVGVGGEDEDGGGWGAEGGELAGGRLSFRDRQKVRKEVEVREEAHAQVSEKVFAFLTSLHSHSALPLTPTTSHHLLSTLLNTANTVLHYPSPPSPLLPSLLSCLFSSFLSSPPPPPPHLWAFLHERMRTWMTVKVALERWRAALKEWTAVLLQVLARDWEVEQEQRRRGKGDAGEDAEAEEEGAADEGEGVRPMAPRSSSFSISPRHSTPHGRTPPVSRSPRRRSHRASSPDIFALAHSSPPHPNAPFLPPLTFPQAFQSWLLFLRLPGSPLSTASLPLRQLIYHGLIDSLTTIVDAVHRMPLPPSSSSSSSHPPSTSPLPRYLLPTSNTLLLIYGPSFFDACLHTLNNAIAPSPSLSFHGHLLQPQLNPTLPRLLTSYAWDVRSDHASLFASLCLIFTTRCSSRCDPRTLSSFYHLLRLALSSNQSDIVYTVLRHSTSLFSTSLPSVFLLIPDFLRVIRKLLKQVTSRLSPSPLFSSSTSREGGGPLSSVFSYTTPSTPLDASLGASSHTPLQRRDCVKMSLLTEEGEEGEDDDEVEWMEGGIGSGPDVDAGNHRTQRGGPGHVQSSSGDEEGERENEPPVAVRLACLSILQSWLALPYLYARCPVVPLFTLHAATSPFSGSSPLRTEANRVLAASSAPPLLTFWSLRPHLLHLLLRSLKKDSSSGVKSACLWGLFFLIQQEVEWRKGKRQGEKPATSPANEDIAKDGRKGVKVEGKEGREGKEDREDVICRCLFAILACCRPSFTPTVSHAATEVLRSLASTMDDLLPMRWSKGYTKLRESLGEKLKEHEKERPEAESKGDSEEEEEDKPTGTPGAAGGSTLLDINQSDTLPEPPTTRRASYKRARPHANRPLIVLVLIDSLCLIAQEQLQLVAAALNTKPMATPPPPSTAPALPFTTSLAPRPPSPEQFLVLARVVASLLSCLLEFVMAYPVLLSPSSPIWPLPISVRVRSALFSLIEASLSLRSQQLLARREHRPPSAQSASPFTPTFPAPPILSASGEEGSGGGSGDRRKKPVPPSAGIIRGASSPPLTPEREKRGVSGLAPPATDPSPHGLPPSFLEACQVIEDAAAVVMRHLLVRMHQYPMEKGLGPEQVVSAVVEEEDDEGGGESGEGRDGVGEDRRVHLVYDSSIIVTAYELGGGAEGEGLTRIIVRDMTGKYAWDVSEVEGVDNTYTRQVEAQRRLKVAEGEWHEMEEGMEREARRLERARIDASPHPRPYAHGDSSGEEADPPDAPHSDDSTSFTSTVDPDDEDGEDDDADDSDTEGRTGGRGRRRGEVRGRVRATAWMAMGRAMRTAKRARPAKQPPTLQQPTTPSAPKRALSSTARATPRASSCPGPRCRSSRRSSHHPSRHRPEIGKAERAKGWGGARTCSTIWR